MQQIFRRDERMATKPMMFLEERSSIDAIPPPTADLVRERALLERVKRAAFEVPLDPRINIYGDRGAWNSICR